MTRLAECGPDGGAGKLPRCQCVSPAVIGGSLFGQQSLKTRPTEARQVIYLSFVLPEGRRVITNSLSLEVVRSCKQTNNPKSLCVALATVSSENRQFSNSEIESSARHIGAPRRTLGMGACRCLG